MLTCNLARREELPVLAACEQFNKGALVKKVLAGGHLEPTDPDPVQASMDLVLGHPGTSCAIVGTINIDHLQADVEAARRALG